MKTWNSNTAVKREMGFAYLVKYMMSNVKPNDDIEVYNMHIKIAAKNYGTFARARFEMLGGIKQLSIDNSYGRYTHLQQTKRRRAKK